MYITRIVLASLIEKIGYKGSGQDDPGPTWPGPTWLGPTWPEAELTRIPGNDPSKQEDCQGWVIHWLYTVTAELRQLPLNAEKLSLLWKGRCNCSCRTATLDFFFDLAESKVAVFLCSILTSDGIPFCFGKNSFLWQSNHSDFFMCFTYTTKVIKMLPFASFLWHDQCNL